ncbi:MAG TPA: sigma-70 family RNA polymerase sigma factor, partial [Actinomycetes bacterium]|nr:sigma-70 family RNA polymerase sigma factor [Actinomycetes bacterium]
MARFATGRLGDAEKAEDVTSETFEAVLRNLGSYRAGTDFEAWLFTIAHRRVADVFRRRSRRREVALDEAVQMTDPGRSGPPPRTLPAVGGPEEAVLAAERWAEVAGAFRRLRADQQEVLALRVLGDLSATPGRRGAREVGGCGAGRPAPGPALAARGDGGDCRMTEPRGNGPMDPEDDLAALAGLDLALDELAAGRDVPTERVGGETAALAALATELRAAVPPPPAGAAERGRVAFLAVAASGRAALVATAAGRRPGGRP